MHISFFSTLLLFFNAVTVAVVVVTVAATVAVVVTAVATVAAVAVTAADVDRITDTDCIAVYTIAVVEASKIKELYCLVQIKRVQIN